MNRDLGRLYSDLIITCPTSLLQKEVKNKLEGFS